MRKHWQNPPLPDAATAYLDILRLVKFFVAVLMGLGLHSACQGTLAFGGDPWAGSNSGDDDSTVAADDDTTASDDDTTPGDDDTTPTGGPVHCGPKADLSAGDGRIFTGDASLEMSYSNVFAQARGGAFTATWTGCEAVHVLLAGEESCGVRYEAEGQSYAEQLQETALIVRLHMVFAAVEDTCGDPSIPELRELYFRLSIPLEGPSVEILWSTQQQVVPSDMNPWAEAPFDGDGSEPDEVLLLYQTALQP